MEQYGTAKVWMHLAHERIDPKKVEFSTGFAHHQSQFLTSNNFNHDAIVIYEVMPCECFRIQITTLWRPLGTRKDPDFEKEPFHSLLNFLKINFFKFFFEIFTGAHWLERSWKSCPYNILNIAQIESVAILGWGAHIFFLFSDEQFEQLEYVYR